jgi:hypothetical protein
MVQDFLNSLGGPAAIARELDISLQTVAAWRQRGRIPRWRIPALVGLAVKQGKPIPADLMVAA